MPESFSKTTVLLFEDVFDSAQGKTAIVKREIRMGATRLSPGTRWEANTSLFSGVNVSQHIGHPIVAYDYRTHLEFLGFSVFSPDQSNRKWVMGWAVLTMTPWSLINFFPTEEQAKEALMNAPSNAEVQFGSKRIGSNDDFVF